MVVGRWLLVVGCWLLVACRLWFVVCCGLFADVVVCCLLFVDEHWLLRGGYWLLMFDVVVCCLLLAGRCPSCVVPCVLWVLFVVCFGV